MSGFDPASFGAGFGAGQEAANRAASAAKADVERAQKQVEKSGEIALAGVIAAVELKNEINNKWIPYANRLKASIFANRVQKEDLIAALKNADPTNVDRIVQESEKHADDEYDRITKPGSEEAKKIIEIVRKEAEEGRLDKNRDQNQT